MSPKTKASSGPRMTPTAEAVVARLTESLLHDKLELEVDKIFRALVKLEGSDLHMKVGQPPMVRVGGELKALNRPAIDNEEMVRLLVPMMDERNLMIFEEEGGADFSHTIDVDGVAMAFPRQHAQGTRQHRTGRPSNQQLDSRLQRPVPSRFDRDALPL